MNNTYEFGQEINGELMSKIEPQAFDGTHTKERKREKKKREKIKFYVFENLI